MENLFLTILSISLTTSVVIIALIVMGSLLNKRYVAKWKYGLWIALALRLLVPVNYTVPDSDFQITVPDEVGSLTVSDIFETEDEDAGGQPVDVEIMEAQTAGPQTVMPQNPDVNISHKVRSSFSLMQALSYLWIVGAVCLLIWQLTGFFYCKRKILKRGKQVENSILTEQMFELRKELGIHKDVALLIYENASSPMIIGFRRPVLILPKDEYTANESYYILKHELIHLRRHDVLIKFLLMLSRDIHWFNPIVWMMHKEAVIDMELACDEAVVRGASFEQREAYTETLMSVLHGTQHRGPLLSTQFSGGVRIMKKRFRNILSKANKKNGIILFSLILIMTMVIGTMVGCSMEQPISDTSEEITGRNTAEGGLVNLSAGAQDIFSLSTEMNENSGLNPSKTNDIANVPADEKAVKGRETSTVLTIMKEGMPEDETATLYRGAGYSLYLTDGDWDNFAPDAWQAEKNNQVHFFIGNYEGLNKSQVERIKTAQGYVVENGEMWMQDYDIICRTICYETENDVWTVNFAYPWGEAEEGWLPVMRAMADTFVVDAGYDVGAHTQKAVMPEGEHIQIYEVTYTDETRRNWYVHDPEFKGSYVYDEITVSNITDTTFDFTITRRDFETDETEIIIPLSTAYINEDQTSATYTGDDYTLTFDFSYKGNPLPTVLFIKVWGMDSLEGILFYNNNIPGYEAE
ncbi:MAG: M56 family metallopeptidase [Lachnospiraceae bacterium]|nr:M56 family metallopeptidase [Lachnospiraceae bacterium]